MIIVTGAAGFIGSNLVKGLNQRGYTDILAVDDLTDGRKFKNLVGCQLADYQDADDFMVDLKSNLYRDKKIEAIFHQGACSTTTEWNGRYMMRANYTYAKQVLHFALEKAIPFFYASSAAVYGLEKHCQEQAGNENPLNVYGYSKWLFDQYVRRLLPLRSQVAGLRYFNVYGPGEDHKGSQASVAWHLHQQLQAGKHVRLFQGNDGYADGEQRRDFVYVEDVVRVNLWLLENPQVSGIFNVGTGAAETFNLLAKTMIALHGSGEIEYIPFPQELVGRYQSFTQADIGLLRQAGYLHAFHTVEQGLQKYYQALISGDSERTMQAHPELTATSQME